MKRTLWLELVVGVLLMALAAAFYIGLLIALADPAGASHYRRACPYHITQGLQARQKYVRCEARRIQPPGGPPKALSVGRCESGLRASARNGPYSGVYQHHIGYWPGRMRTYIGSRFPADGQVRRSVWAFRTNVLVSLRMARASGWGAWSCA